MDKEKLAKIVKAQRPNGQFPTTLFNDEEQKSFFVDALTPTYLICLIMMKIKEKIKEEPDALIDVVINSGLNYLESVASFNEIENLWVWHFNSFYPPDWEDTCWCSYLLWRNGRLHERQLESLKELMLANVSERGIGVWIKDNYSIKNTENNVFDPIVSISALRWLWSVFRTVPLSLQMSVNKTTREDTPSLYYCSEFQKFFYYLINERPKPEKLKNNEGRLFHHASRKNLWYASPEVWLAAEMYLEL